MFLLGTGSRARPCKSNHPLCSQSRKFEKRPAHLAGRKVSHDLAQVPRLLLLEPRHLPSHPLDYEVVLLFRNVRFPLALHRNKLKGI